MIKLSRSQKIFHKLWETNHQTVQKIKVTQRFLISLMRVEKDKKFMKKTIKKFKIEIMLT
jgi:hypothetical protein